MRYFEEPAKQIPVFGEYDVVVAGGGPAGIGAAIAAARTGAKTIVIEQMGCLGGISTAGLHPQMQVIQYEEGNVSSIPVEIGIRAEKLDIGLRGYRYGKGCFQYEIEAFKRLLDDMVLEVGCEILYQTLVSDTIVENDVVKGVIIQNKTGRSAVLAKRVVDCTADADVAARGGVEFEQGREQDGLVQPCTLMFRVDGVDVAAVESPENSGKIRLKDGMVKMDKSVWQYAIDNGEMDPFQTKVMGFWVTHKRPTQISVNFTNLTGIDPTKTEDLTKVLIEGRKQAEVTLKILNKYVPGFENAYMIDSALLPGTRESRRIKGEYTLTVDEVLGAKKFEDSIAKGSFFIDIHNPKGTGLYDPKHENLNNQDLMRKLPPGEHYDIPYGCIVPLKVENLLVAGRCISVTHEALGSTRVMMQCMSLGEAAGTAAALSIKEDVTPRKLDVQKLRKTMLDNCVVDPKDI